MNIPRKGYYGHWTDRVERMYTERVAGIKAGEGPKSASQWGKDLLGGVSKHVMRGVSAVSKQVVLSS